MKEFDELLEEQDATELARIARALDVSHERGPRAEFLATLRARLEREAYERPLRRRFTLPQLRLAWTAPLAAAVVLAILSVLAFPQPEQAPIPVEQRLVLASESGFTAYDPLTLEVRERKPVPAPDPWVMLAPDQRTLVFTHGAGAARRMRILDIRNPDPRAFRDVSQTDLRDPHQFALSRDGSLAYVRAGDKIQIVDVLEARVIGAIATPGISDSPVYLAPDDRRLFQFRPEGALVVYDVVELRELGSVPTDLRDIPGQSASARLVFSSDGARLYAVGGTGSPSGFIRVLVLDAASLAIVADGSIDPSNARRLSRELTPLARADELLGSLGFVADAKELGTVTQIALSPDGRVLYAARGNAGEGIVLIDTLRLDAIGLVESGRSVFGLQLSPDGSRLFALAGPTGLLGSATLVAIDTRSYGAVATASIRNTAADTATLIYKP